MYVHIIEAGDMDGGCSPSEGIRCLFVTASRSHARFRAHVIEY